jgi:hypothetical protein
LLSFPKNTYYKPQALHKGAPSSSLLQSGVVVVAQLEHTNCIASSSFASFLALWGFSVFGLGALCNFWLLLLKMGSVTIPVPFFFHI